MLGRLLAFLIFFVCGALIVLFLLGKSPNFQFSPNVLFSNPFALTTDPETGLRLPTYNIPYVHKGLELGLDDKITGDARSVDPREAEEALLELEREYDNKRRSLAEAKTFGDPSPYRGKIEIDTVVAKQESSREAYVAISTTHTLEQPVNLSGWSLQSVLSGTRIFIPQGATMFRMGIVNNVGAISLDAGEVAYISAGTSPVGISFKENGCTGYLEQFQNFEPDLSRSCGNEESIQLDAREHGAACESFADSIPSCTAYLGVFPPGLSLSCVSYIRNSLTYNGCVARHEWRASFKGHAWRIFLNQSRTPWRSSHDVIRLLDEKGKVVDVWSY